jgi:E3 ubiquitin-protein ligase SHPRH
MEHSGDYGNKIETLIRHLLYLQLKEPENKSIVFSAWADSLHSTSHSIYPLPV